MQTTCLPDFSGIDPETGEPWDPRKVVQLLGLRAINDPAEVRALCERALTECPAQVEAYRSGKRKALGALMKRAMELSQDGIHPKLARQTFEELLG